MTEADAKRIYGHDAAPCGVCGEWGLDGDHFDGTYFTCDPKAPPNQPGYDYTTDPERL